MPCITDTSFEDDSYSDDGEQVAEQVAVGHSEGSGSSEKFLTKFGKFLGHSAWRWITCLL